jgi:hypothetical protein
MIRAKPAGRQNFNWRFGNCIPIVQADQLNPPKRFSIRVDAIECVARVHSVAAASDVV